MPMIAQELRSFTKGHHASLEKRLITRIKNIRTRDAYAELLALFYGFYHPLENRLGELLTESNFPGYTQRRKSERIIKDLEPLTGGFTVLEETDRMPDLRSFAGALGALYVLEGSTLGGEIIAGMIERQLEPMDFFFLRGYGPDTAKMWAAFTACLDQPFKPEEQTEILETAKETFITFNHWIDRYEQYASKQ